MKIGAPTESVKMKPEKLVVAVIQVGEALDGKQKGKQVRQTLHSVDIVEAKPEEVWAVVFNALQKAAGNPR